MQNNVSKAATVTVAPVVRARCELMLWRSSFQVICGDLLVRREDFSRSGFSMNLFVIHANSTEIAMILMPSIALGSDCFQ